MATDRLTTLEQKVEQIIISLNDQTTNAKTIDQLTDANQPIGASDHLLIGQGTEARKMAYSDLTSGSGLKFIHHFTASEGQTSFTVNAGVILDDGMWFCQVNSEMWNSINGTTALPGGNISINFATGVVTLQNGFSFGQGDHVIFKHN